MNRLSLGQTSQTGSTPNAAAGGAGTGGPERGRAAFAPFSSDVGGMVRPLRFVLPVGYERNYRYPLLIWLHSHGFNENQVSDVMPHISPQNYIGVGIRGSRSIDPAGHRFDWATSPAAIVRCEEAVWQAIDQAVERYSVHPERIFIAGYAEGGMMATRVALSHPESFAGCISIGGRFPTGGGVLSNLHAARSLPQMWAIGRDNPKIDEAKFKSDLHLISTARLKMEIRQYTVDDEMVKEILADVDRWIMNRINPPPSGPAPLDIWGSVEVGFSGN